MNHSEDWQQSYDELLDQLTDTLNPTATNLETLSGVVQAFLWGKASEDTLLYYLSEQFHVEKEQLPELVMGLVDMKRNFPPPENNPSAASLEAELPKVSIIITTYNRKEFLNQAIQSILMQDYPRKEIIVIDDCSTDGTDILMKQSFGGDARVIYMRNEKNRGPGHNRRLAFAAHADGEYILFLDDDDYLIDRSYLSQAVDFHLLHPETSFVAANVFLKYSQTEQLKISSLGLSEIINKQDYFMNFEQKGYPKPASTLTTVFKREALIQMDILNMNMVNDASIYLRSLLIGDAGFIDVIAGVYRIHGNNITFNLSQSFLIENLEEKMLIKNMAIEQYGYNAKEMNQWFNHNVYDTIYYYLMNSAKSYKDFEAMYVWAHTHCPGIYDRLRREFRVKLMKKQLLRVSLIRTLLKK
ncbi:glycosyltransferase family 2 protein [Paenibacillus wynnii]|uniref:glycosyltransferase family 2 protein n=1 Tax=Paenibacillus wynnii TaxID=268407 RepID=UPI00278E6266|nr:glycosyltransferase family A protein [Paenibacillus wynnii]MDQ0196511.1 glycosyltransferase involved in cell wall biosynthesis [Paenibacillus wynnii]